MSIYLSIQPYERGEQHTLILRAERPVWKRWIPKNALAMRVNLVLGPWFMPKFSTGFRPALGAA